MQNKKNFGIFISLIIFLLILVTGNAIPSDTYTCQSSKGQCSGTDSCVVNVEGTAGEKVQWTSSCGGNKETTINGQNKDAEFDCSTSSGNNNHPTAGWLDNANCVFIRGWAVDKDNPSVSISVQLYKDNGAGTAETLVQEIPANQESPDLNKIYPQGNHRFTIATPVSLKDGKTHQLFIQGVDASPNPNKILSGVPKTISCTGDNSLIAGTTFKAADASDTELSAPVQSGSDVKLKWTAGNSVLKIKIEDHRGNVKFERSSGPMSTGSNTQNPQESTTYILTATYPSGDVTKWVPVTVQDSASSTCNPVTQLFPHWRVKNGQCLASCGILGGTYCSVGDCPSGYQPVPNGLSGDCNSCCKEIIQSSTCAAQNGFTCAADKLCTGTGIQASDTTRCCSTACVTPAWTSCSQCGNGLFNLCDRQECNSITQNCYFIPNLISGDCNACSGKKCEDYGNQQTCSENHCGFQNCHWNNNQCAGCVPPPCPNPLQGCHSEQPSKDENGCPTCGNIVCDECNADKPCLALDCVNAPCTVNKCVNGKCVQSNVPVITSPNIAVGTLGIPFTYQIAATNNPTSFDDTFVGDSLHLFGLSVNKATGLISGTPATKGEVLNIRGTDWNFKPTASNTAGTGESFVFVRINPNNPNLPRMTSPAAAVGTVGVPFTYQITTSNPSANIHGFGNVPGLSIDSATGLISGTPTTAGVFINGIIMGCTSPGKPIVSSDGSIFPTCGSVAGEDILTLTINPSNILCGNSICDEGEADFCPPCTKSNPPCKIACKKGTCPQDCKITSFSLTFSQQIGIVSGPVMVTPVFSNGLTVSQIGRLDYSLDGSLLSPVFAPFPPEGPAIILNNLAFHGGLPNGNHVLTATAFDLTGDNAKNIPGNKIADTSIQFTVFNQDGDRKWVFLKDSNQINFEGSVARMGIGMSGIVFNRQMWLMGGILGGNRVISSVDGANWIDSKPKSNIWAPRNGHASTVFKNKMWVFGGLTKDGLSNDVWSSEDGVNWNLATANAAWPPRYFHSAVAFNNKLWIVGGVTALKNPDGNPGVWSSEDGINWNLATADPGWTPGKFATTLVFNNKLWAIIGSTIPPESESFPFPEDAKVQVWSSSDGIKWTQTTQDVGFIWGTASSYGAVVHDNKIWIMGDKHHLGSLPDVNEVFSSSDGTAWQREIISAFPSSFEDQGWHRNGYSVSLVNDGKIFMLGISDDSQWVLKIANTPPKRTDGQPSRTLSEGTTSTTISLKTDESAKCKYSKTANVQYSEMTETFSVNGLSSSGVTSHTATVSGLINGKSYKYYVKCKDEAGNFNTDDFIISFSVGGLQKCVEQNGFICEENKMCPGSPIKSSDTERCCSVNCVTPSWSLCSHCGNGWFNLCDRVECNSISQGCYFVPNSISGDCNACSGKKCEDYTDKETCGEDHCGFANCEWKGDKCKTKDATPPSVSINSPASGSQVSGTVIVLASASDNVGVAGVQFVLDNNNLGAEVTSSPYQVSWDTAALANANFQMPKLGGDSSGKNNAASNGEHTLKAVARDVEGNKGASSSVAVTVTNDLAPPKRTDDKPSGTLAAFTASAILSLNTDEPATCRYSATANTAYFSMTDTFSTTGSTLHSTTISGFSNGNTYSYYVKCKDTSGNFNTDDFAISFSVAATPTCAEQNGFICGADKMCAGSQLTASDTTRCCSIECVTPSWTLCSQCGNGFFNLCDRVECNSISEKCYFIPNLASGDCFGCSGKKCEDYTDKDTCGEDHCRLTHCSWNGIICATLVDAPVISSFTANPTTIKQGQSATLSWSVSGATSLTIDKGIGDVTSLTSKSVSPISTTTYTLTATNSAGSATKTVTIAVQTITNPNQKYFGYFGAAFIGSCSPNSCVSEISDHSNLYWTSSSDLSGVQTAASLGMKSMVDVSGIFFKPNWPPSMVKINPDYLDDWSQFKQTFGPYIQNGDIVALYPGDEPDALSSWSGISWDDMKNNLEKANNLIHSDYPNLATGVIFTNGFAFTNKEIPNGYNWVGFDCYTDDGYLYTWDSCRGHSILEAVFKLESKMNPSQKIILVPDGQIFPGGGTITQGRINAKLDVIDKYYALARSDDRIIAISPYLWASYPETFEGNPVEYTGTRDILQMKARYKQIGKELISGVASENAPVITQFNAPSSINYGQSATISWQAPGARLLILTGTSGEVYDVTGFASKSVSPTQATTYTLTASNFGGHDTKSVNVAVTENCPCAVHLTGNPWICEESHSFWFVTDCCTTWPEDNGYGC